MWLWCISSNHLSLLFVGYGGTLLYTVTCLHILFYIYIYWHSIEKKRRCVFFLRLDRLDRIKSNIQNGPIVACRFCFKFKVSGLPLFVCHIWDGRNKLWQDNEPLRSVVVAVTSLNYRRKQKFWRMGTHLSYYSGIPCLYI